MNAGSQIHRRKSMRLKGFDYASAGAYFVTICTQDKKCLFGKIVDEKVNQSPIGRIAESCWQEIPQHFGHVNLDYYVVMPNHFHGILFFADHNDGRGVQLNAPTEANFYSKISPNRKTLSVVIRTFKAAVTRQCRLNGHGHFKWQRGFYDRIVRDEDELNRIREYIITNPVKWQIDKENPTNL